MKKALLFRKIWFYTALAVSVIGVASIPGIIFSAIGEKWVLMAFCIMLVLNLFYGGTFYWMAFARSVRLVHLTEQIEIQRLLSVPEISLQLGCSERETVSLIRRGIAKGIIVGYLFDGTVLSKIIHEEPEKPKKITLFCEFCHSSYKENACPDRHCPSCGAQLIEREEVN